MLASTQGKVSIRIIARFKTYLLFRYIFCKVKFSGYVNRILFSNDKRLMDIYVHPITTGIMLLLIQHTVVLNVVKTLTVMVM